MTTIKNPLDLIDLSYSPLSKPYGRKERFRVQLRQRSCCGLAMAIKPVVLPRGKRTTGGVGTLKNILGLALCKPVLVAKSN